MLISAWIILLELFFSDCSNTVFIIKSETISNNWVIIMNLPIISDVLLLKR